MATTEALPPPNPLPPAPSNSCQYQHPPPRDPPPSRHHLLLKHVRACVSTHTWRHTTAPLPSAWSTRAPEDARALAKVCVDDGLCILRPAEVIQEDSGGGRGRVAQAVPLLLHTSQHGTARHANPRPLPLTCKVPYSCTCLQNRCCSKAPSNRGQGRGQACPELDLSCSLVRAEPFRLLEPNHFVSQSRTITVCKPEHPSLARPRMHRAPATHSQEAVLPDLSTARKHPHPHPHPRARTYTQPHRLTYTTTRTQTTTRT